MKILLQAIKSLIRKVELVAKEASEEIANYFGSDGIIKRKSLPDGYPYAVTVTVLPETTLTDRSDDFWGLGYGLDLVDHATYTVDWNGTRYSCVARFINIWGLNCIYLGSLVSGDELEYPFCIASVEGNDTTIQPLDDSTTVTIAITGPKITKINAAYIPRLDATNIQNGEGEFSICSVNAITSAKGSIAFGDEAKAYGISSFSFGYMSDASGDYSFAFGGGNGLPYAGGISSFAFGSAGAYGDYSFAFGDNYHHAEGKGSFAFNAVASADYSHAEGEGVIASGVNQFVYGKYNIEDTENKYSHIVGNGDSSNRSNAHTLDWDGNAWFAGTMEGTALILSSPNGTRFKITVSDSGVLSATEVTE